MVSSLTGATFDDEGAVGRLFGDPPRVVLEFAGDPPEAITIWPLNTWLEKFQTR
jgi:hypothetical protein